MQNATTNHSSSEALKSYNALALQNSYEQLKRAFERSGSWNEAWKRAKKFSTLDAEQEWEKVEREGVRVILSDDPLFPPRLREIPWPPFGLYVKGAPLKDTPAVAIVGTRRATEKGKSTAERFGRAFGESGITVVSGLALGIDAAAHTGTVSAKGISIAVLACGLDAVYPRTNETLARNLLACGGTVVSEYPIGSPALPHRFIERNRIVSGLSLGALVIEAPAASGALATARFALEQNRDVFVTPGPLDHPNYEGSHGLIKAGALLVTSPDDIVDALNLAAVVARAQEIKKNREYDKLDKLEKAVFNAIQANGAMDADAIARVAGMDVPAANAAASFLVIKGIVKDENGKYSL